MKPTRTRTTKPTTCTANLDLHGAAYTDHAGKAWTHATCARTDTHDGQVGQHQVWLDGTGSQIRTDGGDLTAVTHPPTHQWSDTPPHPALGVCPTCTAHVADLAAHQTWHDQASGS